MGILEVFDLIPHLRELERFRILDLLVQRVGFTATLELGARSHILDTRLDTILQRFSAR